MSRIRYSSGLVKRGSGLLLLSVVLLLGGCSAGTSYLVYEDNKARVVWPEAPEVPRYRYVGQLTGDENIVTEGRGFMSKVYSVLTGLTRSDDERVVLQRPQSGVVDEARRRIYVTDVSRQGVFVFDERNGTLDVWSEVGKHMSFASPVGIALEENGNLLVADADLALVVRLSPEGKSLGSFGDGHLKRPTGIARDPLSGRIYVADTHAHNVKIFDATGRYLQSIGERGAEPGQLNFPTYLAFAGNELYVTDTMNSRIQIFSADGRYLRSFGQRGLYLGNLPRPKGVTLDSEGNIYVVESYYDHLLVFNNQGEFLLPIGGTGTGIGEFYLPSGVWRDSRNRIFISDMFNGRILILQYLGSGNG